MKTGRPPIRVKINGIGWIAQELALAVNGLSINAASQRLLRFRRGECTSLDVFQPVNHHQKRIKS